MNLSNLSNSSELAPRNENGILIKLYDDFNREFNQKKSSIIFFYFSSFHYPNLDLDSIDQEKYLIVDCRSSRYASDFRLIVLKIAGFKKNSILKLKLPHTENPGVWIKVGGSGAKAMKKIIFEKTGKRVKSLRIVD